MSKIITAARRKYNIANRRWVLAHKYAAKIAANIRRAHPAAQDSAQTQWGPLLAIANEDVRDLRRISDEAQREWLRIEAETQAR